MLNLVGLAVMAPVLCAALPPGTAIIGVGTTDGFETEVRVVGPDGHYDVVTTISHARGRMPKGARAPSSTGDILVVVHELADGASPNATLQDAVVIEIDLASGGRTPLAAHALRTQAPTWDDAGSVVYVHQERDGVFAVMRAPRLGGVTSIADVHASWLTPARGASSTFLEVDNVAHGSRVMSLDARGKRTVRAELGAGRFRSAVVRAGDVVVERGLANGRAQIVDGTGRVVLEGLAGMDPLPIGASALAVGAGTKRAQVLVGHVSSTADGARFVVDTRLDAGRAGIASPRAAALVNGAPVVIAWLDRGASLPGELWLLTPTRRTLLVEPRAGVAVEVYGVVDDVGGAQ